MPQAGTADAFALPELVEPDPLVEFEPLPVDVAVGSPLEPELDDATSVQVAQPVAPLPQAYPPANPGAGNPQTQIQQLVASLLHVQTSTPIELPVGLPVIHVGKPNDRIPPDIDVAGFPNSEIVSRIHADIRMEGDTYFIEDVGSANGTYINNNPLPPGNRHRLRSGDRIALGKGDLVTFLFQLN